MVKGRTGLCVQDYAMVAHLLLEFPPGLSVEVSHVGEAPEARKQAALRAEDSHPPIARTK